MALKVTTFKKSRVARAPKETAVEKFLAACEIQIRIANGETVLHKQTKKPLQSWVKDYEGQKALCPKVGNSLMFEKKQGFAIGDSTVEKVLRELIKEVQGGKHVRVINSKARKPKS